MSETLLRDLIALPESVSRGDFVLNLDRGVKEMDSTIGDYVVTPQLVKHFDEALKVIQGAVSGNKSRGTYLDGSFGSGKSHFMAVLNFLLAGEMKARTISKLAPVVSKHDPWMQGKKFLMVPYHMIGARSLESAILGGYVHHMREAHPKAPTPPVFRSQEWMQNAQELRASMGDTAFFEKLNSANTSSSSDGWGSLGGTWNGDSFTSAIAAGPEDEAYRRLSSDLLDTFFTSIRKEGDFVSLDEGFSVISEHAKNLGYDALVLFLDEMILWLASKASDVAFISSEVPKVSKLVESAKSNRPIPIVSFIARQRDLRELMGEHAMGAENLNFADQLKYWEGRFGQIKLEDANLPFIAEERVLKAKSSSARSAIDAEFERTAKVREAVMNVLLTKHSNRDAFRRLYPFSPALVETLVAVSSLLQRERTALKIMLQLLVDQKDTLRLGELVPVGDLYDQIAEGDEAFSSEMKRHFDTADQLYRRQLQPMLEEQHQITFEAAEALDYRDPKREALRNDDRLIKTLLLAALAPGVESLKNLTPERLAALNHGTIKSPIPGQESSIVLGKLRMFAGRCGQIKIPDGASQPIVSIQLSGVDVDSILDRAETHDNFGNRIRLLKQKLFAQLGFQQNDNLWMDHRIQWKGTQRTCKVFFQNVRETETELLENDGDEWKLVIDYPIDKDGHGPQDDLARLEKFKSENTNARTIVWLPSILSQAAQDQLGKLVRLEHILDDNRFKSFVQDLSPQDQESAKGILKNMRDAQNSALITQLGVAYGLDLNDNGSATDSMRSLRDEEHFQSLDSSLQLQVPAATQLAPALEEMLQQALRTQYPAHPNFSEDLKLTKGAVEKVCEVISTNLRSKDHRSHVEKSERSIVRLIANPLRLGDMGETHFVIGEHWKDHLTRMAGQAGSTDGMKVSDLRAWIDQPDPMGLPKLLQDLIILTYAQQTNRSFTLHGGPFTPEINNIHNDCTLKLQALPSDEAWEHGVEIAQTVLGAVSLPGFVSGQNVVTYSDRVKETVKDKLPAVKLLEVELRRRASDFNCKDIENAPRIVAASETKRLLEAIQKESNAKLVESLSTLRFSSPLEALASSLKSAKQLAERLPTMELAAIDSAANLAGARGTEGTRLRQELFEAFEQNEYVIALGKTYDHVQRRAIELMSEALKEQTPPPPAPTPPVAPKPVPATPRPKSHRSQIKEDPLPAGIDVKHVDVILSPVEVPGGGGKKTLWVSKNMEALILADTEASYDEQNSKLTLPKFNWEGTLESE